MPPTPTVTLPATGAAQQSTLVAVPANPLVSSIVATVTTAGTNVGGASEQVASSSTVATVVVTASLTAVSATNAASTCTANAAGSAGSTTITGLTIGALQKPSVPCPPTTRLPSVVPGLTVTANHQVQSDGAGSASISVDALYIQLTPTVGTPASVVVGSRAAPPPVRTS